MSSQRVVVPAGDVRGPEQALAGEIADPRPLVADPGAPRSQQADDVDDRRLDHGRAAVEGGVHQDRLDHRPNGVVALDVQVLKRLARLRRGRHRDEVAPQLLDEEGPVGPMTDAEPTRVGPVEVAALTEDGLRARVVALGVEVEVDIADVVLPVGIPAGERARLLADVVLRVGVAGVVGGAEREQLHHLAGVVLVRRPAGVVEPRKPDQHRRVDGDVGEQIRERPHPAALEQLGLLDRELLRVDVGGREPVVPDQCHALDHRVVGADHPVEPPQLVVAVGVERREREPVLVDGLGALQPVLALRPGEPVHRALEVEPPRELRGLTGAGPESGAPEQPRGLALAELSLVDGDR